jgi:hypothetical protein
MPAPRRGAWRHRDPLRLGRDLLEEHGIAPTREGLAPPVLFGVAIEKACGAATDEVAKKIRTVGKIALAVLGDVPVVAQHREDWTRVLRRSGR